MVREDITTLSVQASAFADNPSLPCNPAVRVGLSTDYVVAHFLHIGRNAENTSMRLPTVE